jgi:ferredoxin-NADP reductase
LAVEKELKIIDVIRRRGNAKSFRMLNEDAISFKAGQYLILTADIEGERQKKAFSLSSSPADSSFVEFTKRITGSSFSRYLDRLEPGDIVKVQMPLGNFTFKSNGERAAFLAAGIGITPFRSILAYLCDTGAREDIIMLYGASSEKDIIFKEELDLMAVRSGGIKIVYCITSDNAELADNKSEAGYIDRKMLTKNIKDLKSRRIYICGPPGMVGAVTRVLEDLSVPSDMIETEKFRGY